VCLLLTYGALPTDASEKLLTGAEKLLTVPDDLHYHRADAILTQVDLGDWSVLIDPTEEELSALYAAGLSTGLPLVGLDVDLDQANERSVNWARDRAASLVTQIEENTRDMLRDTVAQAIEEGWSADELAQEIAGSIGFSDDRAETIARTELIAANNQGNLAAYKDAASQGIAVQKEWLTAGDDLVSEECQANEDQGPIPLDDDFDSGDDAPPLHPNCRCAVAPVVSDESDSQDEEQ
jgi:SPP1 gp7 family putative phage head morphogenesis protein